ncbi:MAG TPA: leucine/isoleucine/valine transporter permease subunit [Chloroflexi bacterium]|nr:leucine/isoleucine/valine transporter permease subunit [Chloroflexota bacterium]
MKDLIKQGLRLGSIFGVVIIFLILFGLTSTLSDILGEFVNLESRTRTGNPGGLIILFAILSLWAGSMATASDRSNWKPALVSGVSVSLIIALLISGFILLVGFLDSLDVAMRDYLAQLDHLSIQFLLYGRDLTTGVLLTFGIFFLFGILGALLTYWYEAKQAGEVIQKQVLVLKEKALDSKLAKQYKENPRSKWIGYGLLGLVVFITPQFLGKYWNYAMGTVGIYVLMGLGLNIVVGLAGLLDLGYVAFFAIGAYTAGLLTAPAPLPLQIGFWPVLIFSIVMAAFAGILLGIPVLRMRGDYLAIVTLGFGEIIRVLIRSDMLAPYVGGPQGIRDIAGPSLFGIAFSGKAYLYLIIFAILLIILFTNYLQNSKVGRAWMAMREDETVAQAMGINTLYYKLMAFATGAAFAGLGGALFAARNQYTGPADHTLMVSINVLSLLIVGGMGSIPGVIVGAFVLKGLPEILRELDLYRLLVFGGLLVFMMIMRPEGIWPAPRRRMELHEGELDVLPPEESLVGKEG